MRATSGAALMACWMAVTTVAAQVPHNPVSSGSPTMPGSTASAPQLPPPFVTKQAEVEIPFNVRPGAAAESQTTAVRVFVSWDAGKTWHFYEEKRPEDGRFQFRARQDGEFWFATQTINRTGRAAEEPRSPQLRLVIDTQRPQLLVQANVDHSGNVNLSWSAADANLNVSSLKLEYQDAAGSGGPWQLIQPAATTGNSTQFGGQTIFRAAVSSRAINLRAEIADAAGNIAYYSQRMSLNPPKSKPTGELAYSPPADPTATHWPTGNPHVGAGSQLATSAPAPTSPANEEVKIPNLVSNPFVGPGRLASSRPTLDQLPPPTTSAASSAGQWRAAPLPADPTGGPPSQSAATPPQYDSLPMQPSQAQRPAVSAPDIAPAYTPPAETLPQPQPAESLPQPQPVESIPQAPQPQPVEPVPTPTAQRPRLTNSRRFSLDYDIQTVGPEGVAAVELWGTSDGGRTWGKWGADPDKSSPFEIEVNHELVYGFRIVVVGKNGLATSTPQAGDSADIWVGVDLTRPAAKLTGAVYGEGEASGKLDIRWHAEDSNLGGRGVTLAIGDRPDGPFTVIAAGLPNTGQYYWEYDPRSPRQIFLRLEVRDDAGNIAIDQLTEPIKVEGLQPKGQIRGFNPAPDANRGAYRPPARQ
jgi:hypothetical protein